MAEELKAAMQCEELSQVDRLIQELIRFDTSNGSHPEKPCVDHIQAVLEAAGIVTQRFARDADRPNLLARLPAFNGGDGDAQAVGEHGGVSAAEDHDLQQDWQRSVQEGHPLLLYGHVDVVPTSDQSWSVPPFAGVVKDGYLWGRGAIDMKGQVAMFVALFLRLKEENVSLPFELRLLIVSDEEGSGSYGMQYLTQEHPEIFAGVRWALGEIGGFSIRIGGKKLYPVMIGEKQYCHIRITAEGKGGHGSLAFQDTAVERLSLAMSKLCEKRLPVRITPAVSHMVKAMAEALGGIQGMVLRRLLNPGLTDFTLKLLGDSGKLFDPLLHNNINVTMIKGGTAPNVVPAQISCDCDLRIVPGCTAEEAVSDVRRLIGGEFKIEIVEYDQGSSDVEMTLFSGLAEALRSFDPEGQPVPFVLSAVTDGRYLSPLGIQTYGFTPMAVPADYDFTAMAHSADERIPLGAADFGVEVLHRYITELYHMKCGGEES